MRRGSLFSAGFVGSFLLLTALAARAKAEIPQPAGDHAPTYPQVVLNNGTIRAVVYLPDADKGYYRAARFDWSGQVARVECNGHVFFTPFREPHDPKNVEAAIGTVDEFGFTAPPGYDDPAADGKFIKIGVGVLQKPADKADKPYFFMTPYANVKPGEWHITSGDQFVQFEQDLTHGGWGYHYVKRISLTATPPGFTIDHTLKNTGTKAIDTNVYCHNFLSIDDAPIGPGYRLTFPFTLKPEDPKTFEGRCTLGDKSITIDKLLTRSVHSDFLGIEGKPAENGVTVENTTTGGVISLTGDASPQKVSLYGEHHVLCPEIFTAIKIAPGVEVKWKTAYSFGGAKRPTGR